MENKAHAMAAGLFVLLVGALLVALGYWISSDEVAHTTYELSTTENVSGLQPQAPVRYKGVPAGRVLSIGFDPREAGRVIIHIDVDSNAPISATTYATLGYQGITGLAHILLSDAREPLQKQARGASGLPRIPMKESPFSQLAEQGPLLLSKIQDAADRLNRLLGDDNLALVHTMFGRINATAQSMDRLALSLEHTVKTGVDPALAQLPALVGETRQTLRTLREAGSQTAKAVQDVGAVARRINAPGGLLEDMGSGMRSYSGLAERASRRTLPQIDRVADEAAQAARALTRAADAVSENPQGLVYGAPRAAPGPGEPGFVPPPAATQGNR
ncbi:MlaD family protein [Comamonas sp. NLF-1-9]|uniref:MlaD family protein n=1 Tax=Comamonas sp. NLF-1-9 TaxID=2853163 RepID=UPI001C445F10|nr:MlaD family protein [Comamonas sp. NLF-1-9]QXL83703.1 MCE family protein [Comamonas sp. NLF-1-9]